jgi:hypothetical protein
MTTPWITTDGMTTFRPERTVRRISSDLLSLCCLASTDVPAAGGRPVLGGEARAALRTAVRQDRPTSTRAHPRPETVLACPTPVVGLEGALHDPCSWGKVGRLGTRFTGRSANASALGYGPRPQMVKPGSLYSHHLSPTPESS